MKHVNQSTGPRIQSGAERGETVVKLDNAAVDAIRAAIKEYQNAGNEKYLYADIMAAKVETILELYEIKSMPMSAEDINNVDVVKKPKKAKKKKEPTAAQAMKKAVRELRDQGKTVIEISKELDINVSSVCACLRHSEKSGGA